MLSRAKKAGIGPGLVFARHLAKLLDLRPEHAIGLVPCAVGGTSLKEWEPHGKLWSDAVGRVRDALADAGPAHSSTRLEAILWWVAPALPGT